MTTRDEAIAIVIDGTGPVPMSHSWDYWQGVRAALEALAAAGVFSDSGRHVCGLRGFGALGDTCPACGLMAEKLDAAGIR